MALRAQLEGKSRDMQVSMLSAALCELLSKEMRGSVPVLAESKIADINTDWNYRGSIKQEVIAQNSFSKLIRPFVEEELKFPLFVSSELKGLETVQEVSEYLVGEIHVPFPSQESNLQIGNWWPSVEEYQGRILDGSRMVFLLGSGRSGTTLLRAMLDAHQDLYSPPELHLLPFNQLRQRIEVLEGRGWEFALWGFRQAYKRFTGNLTGDEPEIHPIPIEVRDADLPSAYEALFKWGGGRILIDKSPTYIHLRGILDRAEALFNKPRYIYLTRHPFSVMESFVRMRFNRLLGTDVNPWNFAESSWTLGNRNAIDFLEGIPEERKVHVRFEDLVTDIEQVQCRICAMIGVEFDPSIIDPYAKKAGLVGAGDPNFKNRDSVDPRLGEVWKCKRPPLMLLEETRRIARILGYSVE